MPCCMVARPLMHGNLPSACAGKGSLSRMHHYSHPCLVRATMKSSRQAPAHGLVKAQTSMLYRPQQIDKSWYAPSNPLCNTAWAAAQAAAVDTCIHQPCSFQGACGRIAHVHLLGVDHRAPMNAALVWQAVQAAQPDIIAVEQSQETLRKLGMLATDEAMSDVVAGMMDMPLHSIADCYTCLSPEQKTAVIRKVGSISMLLQHEKDDIWFKGSVPFLECFAAIHAARRLNQSVYALDFPAYSSEAKAVGKVKLQYGNQLEVLMSQTLPDALLSRLQPSVQTAFKEWQSELQQSSANFTDKVTHLALQDVSIRAANHSSIYQNFEMWWRQQVQKGDIAQEFADMAVDTRDAHMSDTLRDIVDVVPSSKSPVETVALVVVGIAHIAGMRAKLK